MTQDPADTSISRQQLERLFSAERLSTYVDQCDDDFAAAVELYRWNAAVTAAFWEPIGHLEVALRNALSMQLADRHRRLGRNGSWLDDPNCDLNPRARDDIAAARFRVRQKGKQASEGQTISELSFGFWRFLITKKLTSLWPDLASAFPDAPDRRRETVEEPLARLHDFRNRLAHHIAEAQTRPGAKPQRRRGRLLRETCLSSSSFDAILRNMLVTCVTKTGCGCAPVDTPSHC